MCQEALIAGELHFTDTALCDVLWQMCSTMGGQMGCLGKCSTTLITPIWFFTWRKVKRILKMCALQSGFLCEPLLCIKSHMGLECKES